MGSGAWGGGKVHGKGGGGGAQQMSTSFHIKVHIKYASTNGCYQLHSPLEILFQISQTFPIQICSGDSDQV